MGTFDLGRKEGFPSQYPSAKTPVTVDVLEIGLILAFGIVAVAFSVIILGFGLKKITSSAIRVICSLVIGGCLIVANFGQNWEVGSVENTNVSYRAGSPHVINATVGIKLGLRSVNVTLKGNGYPNTSLENETINYNERFWWTWDQGRFGFGPYAGLIQRSFREAQRNGLPIPILSVIEYFVIDGEGIRFGRFYRTAGWYTHIIMWTAFTTWVLSNIFMYSVARYSACYLAVTGGLQILACILWVVVRNPYPLVIPFESGQIRTSYGVHYWITLICGIFCLLLAAIMLLMDLRCPIELFDFLGLDLVNDCEYELPNTENEPPNCWNGCHINDIEMRTPENYCKLSDDGNVTILRKRSIMKRAQKRLFTRLASMRLDEASENTIYERRINEPGTSGRMQRHFSDSKQQLCSSPNLAKKKKYQSFL